MSVVALWMYVQVLVHTRSDKGSARTEGGSKIGLASGLKWLREIPGWRACNLGRQERGEDRAVGRPAGGGEVGGDHLLCVSQVIPRALEPLEGEVVR